MDVPPKKQMKKEKLWATNVQHTLTRYYESSTHDEGHALMHMAMSQSSSADEGNPSYVSLEQLELYLHACTVYTVHIVFVLACILAQSSTPCILQPWLPLTKGPCLLYTSPSPRD